MILDEGLRRTTAQAEDNHILQIAQQTCQDPARGQIDIAGTHPRNHLLRHGVHDIADKCDGCHDGCRLIDKRLVISRNRHPRLLPSLLIKAIVVITLRQSQEQRDKERHQHQPLGDPDICRQTTNQHTHHKTNGNDRYVEDGILLQSDTIGDIHQPISRYYYI